MGSRQSERTGTVLPVLIRNSNGNPFPGILRNLGDCGLFVETRGRLPIDSQVIVTLDLSRQNRTRREHILGTVVHDRNGGIGVRADDPEFPLHDAVMRCTGQSAANVQVSRWFVTVNSGYDTPAASLQA